MARPLGLTDLGEMDAAAWPGWAAALLEAGRPRLVLARLSGGAIALGRYERSRTTLSDRGSSAKVVRRLTGGRSIALGGGIRALALALPHRSWLIGEDADALPASRFLNRAVRGILAGLAHLGCPAQYFGRDFVTAVGGQSGYVSFEIDASGRALLECFLPVEAHWWLPAECGARPEPVVQRGFPQPARIEALEGRENPAILKAFGNGYAERFALQAEPDESALVPCTWNEPEAQLASWSSPIAVPIGFIEVGVEHAGGLLRRVALRGDFIADSAGIRRIETALVGAPCTAHAVASAINETFRDLRHAILGVPDLSVWAEAFRQVGVQ